ncbi:MAG: hypothetical protein NUV78_02845 [Candidatus Zambryskibacteria bacterium]|nr:hypothetical protein [Candidatus Zambryskibacteria bacterium]
MRCTAANGKKDEDFVQVNVSSTTPPPAPSPAPAPTCSISADHLSVPQGGSTVIRYTSTNATSVIGLSGFSGNLPLSDARGVILGETTTFTIQCSGPGGTSPPQSVTVTVTGPACPTSIDYSPKEDLKVNVGGSRAITVDNWPSNVSCNPFYHVDRADLARIKGTKTCLVDGKPFWCGPAATIEGVYPGSVRATVQIDVTLPRPEKSRIWTVKANTLTNTLTDMLGLDLSFMSNNGRDKYGVCQTLACK